MSKRKNLNTCLKVSWQDCWVYSVLTIRPPPLHTPRPPPPPPPPPPPLCSQAVPAVIFPFCWFFKRNVGTGRQSGSSKTGHVFIQASTGNQSWWWWGVWLFVTREIFRSIFKNCKLDKPFQGGLFANRHLFHYLTAWDIPLALKTMYDGTQERP